MSLLDWRVALAFLCSLLLTDPAHAQLRPDAPHALFSSDFELVNNQSSGERSIPLAFGLSAAVPGAGQVYNRNWLKAGIMAGIEGALIGGHFVWKSRGEDQEIAFQQTAHLRWSPGKYAAWINDYTTFLEDQHGATVVSAPVEVLTNINWQNPEGWTSSEEAQVQDMFNQIRSLENELFHPETGAAFSHRLPFFAEQQYYELIGKYFQFAPGWDDYPAWTNGSGFTGAIDPQTSDGAGNRLYVSDNFYAYADDHAAANDLLRRSSRVLGIVIFNHLFSAVDAAIFSKLHNNRIATGATMTPDSEMSVSAFLQFRF